MAESLKKSMVKNMLWVYIEKISTQGIGFVVSIVLARLLMPEQYGLIAMLSIFMTISNTFIDSGFGVALIQKKSPDSLDYNTVLYTSTFISVLMYIIMYFVAPYAALFFHTCELTEVMRVYTLSFLWTGYNSVLFSYVSKKMLFKKVLYRTLIANLFSGVVGILMAYEGLGVWALVAQNFTGSIVGIIILQCSIDWHPSFCYSFERAKKLTNFGGKIMLSSLIGSGFNELKGLLIGKWYTAADLALFNKGSNLPNLVVSNINSTIGTVLFPAMSQFSDNKEKVLQMVRRSLRLSSYLMFFFMTLLFIICRPLVILLFTEKWEGCVPYMQLICVQYMLEILSGTNLQGMKTMGAGDTILKLEIYKKPVFLLMTVVGAYISVYALALTLPLYALYANVINMRPNRKILGYRIKDQLVDVKAAFLLSFAMVLFAYPVSFFINSNFLLIFLQIVVCFISYWGLSVVFKVDSYIYVRDMVIRFLKRGKSYD